MKTVLISEPTASEAMTFLPYVWGVLKTAAEQVPDLRDHIRWLDPVYERAEAAELLAPYDLAQIDVLGLSCYTWNFELQCEIAALAKRANPAILTVAGGPHPQVKDPDFFRHHPSIDVVVSKDGEETFNALLLTVLRGEGDFAAIPGLYLPRGPAREIHFTGPPRLPREFAVSPYLAQADYYTRLLEQSPNRYYGATWETTRGCPYSCSFCDWGSNTMSKIRIFERERVDAELDWLMRSRVSAILMADANFGILPRDPQIASRIAELMVETGGSKIVHYSAAKNNPDRSLVITQTLMEAGALQSHMLSVQHTSPEVLASISRSNISPDKQIDVARRLLAAGAPVNVQLIIGIPGDNFDRWSQSLARLMEWGLHEDYCVFFFSLLPNAPAADQGYRDEWEISSVKRVIRDESAGMSPTLGQGIAQEIIVGSRNFTPGEWARMNTFTSITRALHCGGLTRLIAIHLHCSHGVGYDAFYQLIFGQFIKESYRSGEIYTSTEALYLAVLDDEDAVADQTKVPELGDDSIALNVAHAVLVRFAMDIERFFAELADFLLQSYPAIDPAILRSLTEYQQAMIVLPDYDPSLGKEFALDHDWPAYFAGIAHGGPGEAGPMPAPVSGLNARVEDRAWDGARRNVDWVGKDSPACWREWAAFAMHHGHKIDNVLHQDVRKVPARPVPDRQPQRPARRFDRLRSWLPARQPAE